MRRPLPLTLLALLLALLPAGAARAQNDAIGVELDQFGVGQVYRPGDFVSLRLKLTSTLTEPVQSWVQVEIANPDGDVGEYGRTVSIAGGGTVTTWIHLPLPADYDPRTVMSVRIFQEEDGRRGAELGGGRIAPGAAIEIDLSTSLIGVVGPGSSRLALDDYTNTSGMSGAPPFAGEDTRVIAGLRPDDLPDRWDGLRAFAAIAWTTFTPRELGDDQVRAIRDYVQRGGHLVIILPDTGNPWGLGAVGLTRFEDLLPTTAPRRDLAVPLSDLLPVLTKARGLPTDPSFAVQVFRDGARGFDVIDNEYVPLVALDDGRIVVIQRTFGFGRITISGLNVADRQLLSMPGPAVQADVWWNRILGRRVDTPSPRELQEIGNARRLATSSVPTNSLGGGAMIEQSISMVEQAGYGLLIALLLIVAYWVATGPPGFLMLKHYGIQRHAWVLFAASAAVFTAAAWGMVSLVKPGGYRVRHITFLDMIGRPGGDRGSVDPQYERAISWFSVNLPGYRRAAITIDSTPGQRDLLASWANPESPSRPFPNPDRYRVDVGEPPASHRVFLREHEEGTDFKRPARSTATQLMADWLGPVPAEWGGRIRSHPEDPVRLVIDAAGNERLEGTLIHDLPGTLDRVRVIWVRNKRTTPRRYARTEDVVHPWVPKAYSGRMLNLGGIWPKTRPSTLWPPEEAFDVGTLTDEPTPGLEAEIRRGYVEQDVKSGFGAGGVSALSPRDRERYLEMYGLFSMLDPPEYLLDQPGRGGADTVAYSRVVGRELDLGPWFTGPCVIVTARLLGVPMPIPLLVDGQPPATEPDSEVFVRWMMPLEVVDAIAFEGAGDTGGGGDDDDDSVDDDADRPAS